MLAWKTVLPVQQRFMSVFNDHIKINLISVTRKLLTIYNVVIQYCTWQTYFPSTRKPKSSRHWRKVRQSAPLSAETKLVPTFKVGNRDAATADAFMQDVASRMKNRLQISTDGLSAYVAAIEQAFGGNVDYGQIVKTYGPQEVNGVRRYSPPEFVSCEKKRINGSPDDSLISTSYVGRLNATTRHHMRRLTRLTLAFSKKLENFEAAVGLHFAYYNFVKRHNTLRCTPAMAAGITSSFWKVGDLLEATA